MSSGGDGGTDTPEPASQPAAEPPGLGVDDDHAHYTTHRSPFGRPPRQPILARTFPVSQRVDRWLVFDAQFVNEVDASGAEAVQQLCAQLAERDVTFVVTRLEDHAQARFDATGLTHLIGAEHFHPTVEAAARACVAADHLRSGGYEPGSREDEADVADHPDGP